jgi:hypothetical protein
MRFSFVSFGQHFTEVKLGLGTNPGIAQNQHVGWEEVRLAGYFQMAIKSCQKKNKTQLKLRKVSMTLSSHSLSESQMEMTQQGIEIAAVVFDRFLVVWPWISRLKLECIQFQLGSSGECPVL